VFPAHAFLHEQLDHSPVPGAFAEGQRAAQVTIEQFAAKQRLVAPWGGPSPDDARIDVRLQDRHSTPTIRWNSIPSRR